MICTLAPLVIQNLTSVAIFFCIDVTSFFSKVVTSFQVHVGSADEDHHIFITIIIRVFLAFVLKNVFLAKEQPAFLLWTIFEATPQF